VATDIAARGINVTRISHVINYDIPSTPDAYIHRIGRTGRATRSGEAFTLITEKDKNMVRSINRIIGFEIEERILSAFGYGSPALNSERCSKRTRKPKQNVVEMKKNRNEPMSPSKFLFRQNVTGYKKNGGFRYLIRVMWPLLMQTSDGYDKSHLPDALSSSIKFRDILSVNPNTFRNFNNAITNQKICWISDFLQED
jgi:superfamily II DNA/RNA helicase